MTWIQTRLLHLKSAWFLPEHLDAWYYKLAEKNLVPVPKLANVDIRQLGLSPTMDLALFGAGGLMGIRAASSLFIGMLVNFTILVPWMISIGEIRPRADGTFSRIHVVNNWALWWGISIMVVAAMTSLFAKPQIIISAFKGLGRKKADSGKDILGYIELPLWISFVGIPIIAVIGVYLMNIWFGVRWDLGLMSVPLIVVLALIAANSTALTSITPTGSLSKIPQFIFGSIDPKHPPTNLMTALMCVEVSSNSSNLLMDIKPGYMLGAKPRQQAIGHCIGIFAGALASTPLFYLLFLSEWKPGKSIMDSMVSDQFSFPSAMQWKGVSDLVQAVFNHGGGSPIVHSAIVAMIVAAGAGLVLEVIRIATRYRFPISPLAIGLGVVVTPDSTMAMFAGALFFWVLQRKYSVRPESNGYKLWFDTQEPICAGLIAGAALVGIADVLVRVFLL